MAGVVDKLKNGDWQAHVQTTVWGKNMHVRGPRRSSQEKRKAESDLTEIRNAGDAAEMIPYHDAIFKAMRNAAEKLKQPANIQTVLALPAEAIASNDEVSAEISNDDAAPTLSIHGKVEELHNGDCEALVEVRTDQESLGVRGPRRGSQAWRKAVFDINYIRAAGNAVRIEGKDAIITAMQNAAMHLKDRDEFDKSVLQLLEKYGKQFLSSVRKPKNAIVATALLSIFQPAVHTPNYLKRLLDARADPNVLVEDDEQLPMHKVIMFAKEEHIAEMKQLLENAGALNTPELQDAWHQRVAMRKARPGGVLLW